ncbi:MULTISPECIES: GntR family transcriptional regulator [unclassified Romboutsia]|uniref:GntR family transcriptional regulator n=1 Tax=unclassified Romboutsia TaxID=2626894 RepID=UPI000822C3D7|nr:MULTISPECIES: GntR family transcriptional regulator [unclassified Romboutsia]SCI26365.1 HTH-type transcriptional repressor yvoA [uncultured Clostridium sp.]
MNWQIDNNKPIYIQLLEQIKYKIVSGEIPIGSKLDSVRVLAQDAQVNPNTMQKALSELERDGLVYSKRTSGRFVTDDKDKINNMRDEIARAQINYLKQTLQSLGYDMSEIKEIISNNL